ncbi:MAG: hypothetical protein H7Y43_04480 [Akkermansiaceae bacterium]|nr:hypothetical protein [Verrucomicrobiales bacterium]
MKTITSLLTLIGVLALAGCTSPRGGTADDYQYDSQLDSGVQPPADIEGVGEASRSSANPSINSRGQSAVPAIPPP